MKKTSALFCLLLIPAWVTANTFPDFNAEYKVNKGMLKATTKLSLQKNKDFYVYKSESKIGGVISWIRSDIITRISNWQFDQSGRIKVKDYTFKHMNGKKRKKYESVHFDWKTQKAANEFKSRIETVTLQPDTLDQFTLELALMRDLKNNKKQLDYSIIDDGKIKHYHFIREGMEDVQTPAGKFKTVKIKRIRKKKNRVTYMWCSPKLGYLPVKIQQTEKGDKHISELTKVSGFN